MIILHIVKSYGNKCNGVSVVVPQYVKFQSEYADVRLVNITGQDAGIGNLQLEYAGTKNFPDYLPSPYNKPDLVVINEANNIENIAIYRNLIKRNIPYIIIPHGELTETALRKKAFKKKIAYILLFNKFIRNAKAVQCLSDKELSATKKKTPEKFIATNGISDMETKKEKFSTDGCKLVYIGRLEVYIKGIDRLIEGIAKIKDYCVKSGVSLDIYGPDYAGRKAEITELIAVNGVGDIVKLHDPVFGEEKINTLLKSDIFIQLSRIEGLPLGILEAMNAGLPVILTEGTNIAEEAESYGYGYYSGETAEEVAETIVRAVEDRERWAEKGKKGVEYTREKYSWQSIAAETVKEYKRITERK